MQLTKRTANSTVGTIFALIALVLLSAGVLDILGRFLAASVEQPTAASERALAVDNLIPERL